MTGHVLLGAVTGAHGLKGEVRVKTFTQTPETLGRYGSLFLEGGRTLTVAHVRTVKADEAVVAFREIADRTAAEALKGARLFVPRAALPATAAEEFYHADLVGLGVEDGEGRALGAVKAIHNFGAGDVIEIARPGGDTVLLPFTRQTVPTLDLENRRMIVAVPEETEAGIEGTVE